MASNCLIVTLDKGHELNEAQFVLSAGNGKTLSLLDVHSIFCSSALDLVLNLEKELNGVLAN